MKPVTIPNKTPNKTINTKLHHKPLRSRPQSVGKSTSSRIMNGLVTPISDGAVLLYYVYTSILLYTALTIVRRLERVSVLRRHHAERGEGLEGGGDLNGGRV